MDTYNSLGRIYVIIEKLDDGLECFEHGLRIAKNIKSTTQNHFIVEAYNNIGRVYRLKNDFAKAIDAYEEALK